MSLIQRAQIIICFLLAGLPGVSQQTIAQGAGTVPTLSAVSMASPFGTVSVSGSGFTPHGLVRLIIHDLTATTYGPHGSQDPAQGYVEGTFPEALITTEVFGPHGSQDPAQGYAPPTMLWHGACPDLLVHSWDARTDTWSNSLDIQLSSC